MQGDAVAYPTLITRLWPVQRAGAARLIAMSIVGSLLLTLSAKIQVPFWPVPMTMQTFVVVMLGLVMGPRMGAAAVLLYLAEGASGLPVFAGTPERGLGLAYMAGPTGGYLAGFLAAAVVAGMLAERGWDRRLPTAAAAAFVGLIVILACGVIWLAVLVGPSAAIEAGLLPFLPAESLKLALITALMPLGWRLTGRQGGSRT